MRIAIRGWPLVALASCLAPAAAQSDPAAGGPHLLRQESIEGLRRPDGRTSSLKVLLPVGAAAARPTVLFVHGWSAEAEYYRGLAENLATRGFAVALFDQVDKFELDIDRWVGAARGALDALEHANADPASPLFGELDTARFAVMGHSYGGATTVGMAALDPRVKVAVALTPGIEPRRRPRFEQLAAGVRVPLLVVGCELDPIVSSWGWALDAFRLAPIADKQFVEIAGGEHNNFTDIPFVFWVWRPFSRTWQRTIPPARQQELSRRYATAWLEHHLSVQQDPGGFTDGSAARRDFLSGALSRFAR